MLRLILAACIVVSTCGSAAAAPSVFVKVEANGMLWDGVMTARILGKSAGTVTTEKLSAYLADTMIYYSYRVCALEPAAPDTFVGIDRATQSQIDEYRVQSTWRAEGVGPGGRRILGQGVFEGCDSEDPRGAALLVTDAMTGEILRWLPMGNYTNSSGSSVPIWVMFLDAKAEGGDELFSTSLCRDCGDRTNVYYDVSRKYVYTEHNGH